MKSTVCNNCGKCGHQFHQCKSPVISYGVIAFRIHPTTHSLEFLMIRRKNSFGYIDFIGGKYNHGNITHIRHLINEMSTQEKNNILTLPYDVLYGDMWNKSGNRWKNEYPGLTKKFELSMTSGVGTTPILTIPQIIEENETTWSETEWEFPKGRKNQEENEFTCAIREFCEETGYNTNNLQTIRNILPFEETFIGTNCKSYKHKYFIAMIDYVTIPHTFESGEVSKTEWKTFDKCIESIRDYNTEKKNIIRFVHKMLTTQFVYDGYVPVY